MPNPVYPGALWNPGVNAGYQAGRTTMIDTVCHYTVGVDSTGIGLRGYFHWLVARDGTIQQFAEADAVTWHAGEFNPYGPGIEIEYYPDVDAEVFTAVQRTACAGLVQWLSTEWAVPLLYHNGVHDTTPGSWNGFISHRSLIQSEQHSDYWPDTDWAAMVGETPSPPYPEETMMLEPVIATWVAAPNVPAGMLFTPNPDPQKLGTMVWLRDGADVTVAEGQGAKNLIQQQVSSNFVSRYKLVGQDPRK